MSFSIVLQTNTSEKNRLDKEVTTIATLSGTLKDGTSIINPVILVEADITALTGCNYCTIDIFGRKYFINDIISVRNTLVELHCHVDVLSSFASEIRALTGITKRQENDWNLYLNDGSIQTYAGEDIYTKLFPSGFSTYQFVLAVAGG